MRHVLSLFDLNTEDIHAVLAVSAQLKAKLKRGVREPVLTGQVAGLLFEKPSMRTRVSFQAGMTQLGGGSLFLGEDVGWGSRESAEDFSRVLSEYVDVIVCRAKQHATVEEIAKYSTCPVINGLTESYHPCQALADLFTLIELRGDPMGLKLAYVGDANNVARSLAIICGRLDVHMSIASPAGYHFDPKFLDKLKHEIPDVRLTETEDPVEAVEGACAVYTDVWASMGQEAEREERARKFADLQVNAKLMSHAPSDAYFLHCLPAHRGEEVTAEVIDGPNSVVIQQAANRMHVQKGLLAWLLDAKLEP